MSRTARALLVPLFASMVACGGSDFEVAASPAAESDTGTGSPTEDASPNDTGSLDSADAAPSETDTDGGASTCSSGATDKAECGNCGTKVRVCNSPGTWSDWSTCTGEGSCAAGAVEEQSCSTGGKRTRSCSDACSWSAWSACPFAGPTELWMAKVTVSSTGSTAASAVTIERMHLSDDSSAGTIVLPTSSDGSNKPLTLSGSSNSDGQLVRSGDGKFVTLAGYGVAPGKADPSTNLSVPRVIARIDGSGDVDTSTSTTIFGGSAVRGAGSLDGSAFYLFGSSGLARVPFGGSGSGTTITTGDIGLAGFFGDSLYLTKYESSGGTVLFYADPPLGSLPPTMLIDTNPSSLAIASPYGMVAFATTGTVIDRVYVADDRSGGGIEQWSLSLGAWSRVKTIAVAAGESVRYVTGYVRGTDVVLFATVTGASSSRVVTYVDSGTTAVPMPTTVRTAAPLTQYRGVVVGPQ